MQISQRKVNYSWQISNAQINKYGYKYDISHFLLLLNYFTFALLYTKRHVMQSIAIDVRMINSSGIGTYLQNLIPLVISNYPKIIFYLLGNKEKLEKYQKLKNVNVVNFKSPIYSIIEQFEFFKKTPEKASLFWSPHYNIPLFFKGKLMVTVHDVFHLAMPQFVSGLDKKLYAKFMLNAVSKKADTIIFNSNFTSNEWSRLMKKNRGKTCITYLGISKPFLSVYKKNNPHNNPFLLYVGNVKPHKNLACLIKAFTLIMDSIPHDLVIVGKKDGFITNDKNIIQETRLLGDRIFFTGQIDDNLLKQYYAHASIMVHPSLYEGFGFTPLEAMATSCPVIVSKVASLPEICSDAALYFNPYNFKELADLIINLLNDKKLQEVMRAKGLEQAKKFTWEQTLKETCQVIDRLLQ
ncbi:MAG: glycosyltransferase family 4 protein [Deltaproteobacteria bacterium]|nr:glycosyltransferase family 4 protein [Deltaproteobacteria bacterium]